MHALRGHVARQERVDCLHQEPDHRVRGFDLGGVLSDVGGVFKGIGEGVVDTAKDIGEAVTHPVEAAKGVARLVTDPTEAWPELFHGVVDPVVDDWKAGNEGEAIGRGIWGVFEAVLGTKGVTKAVKAAKARGGPDATVPDAPRPTPKPDAPKPDAPKPDAPKPDAPKPDAPKPEVTRRARIEELGLSPQNAAFAARVDVEHIFRGGITANGRTNGGHVAPDGAGRYGPLTVREIDNPDAPYRPGHTWRANVTRDGAKGKSGTMYPREWSNDEVVTAIREAERNATFKEVRTSHSTDPDVLYGVGTYRGIEINIQKNVRTGEIITAYPRTTGQAFT